MIYKAFYFFNNDSIGKCRGIIASINDRKKWYNLIPVQLVAWA
jgi:hypothetical protein